MLDHMQMYDMFFLIDCDKNVVGLVSLSGKHKNRINYYFEVRSLMKTYYTLKSLVPAFEGKAIYKLFNP